jgi:hypothetical protein
MEVTEGGIDLKTILERILEILPFKLKDSREDLKRILIEKG